MKKLIVWTQCRFGGKQEDKSASNTEHEGQGKPDGPITKDTIFAKVIEEYPETVDVFMAYGLHCIGCGLNVYDTVEDAGLIHERLVHDLNACVLEHRKNLENGELSSKVQSPESQGDTKTNSASHPGKEDRNVNLLQDDW